jgi:hypothetical protein
VAARVASCPVFAALDTGPLREPIKPSKTTAAGVNPASCSAMFVTQLNRCATSQQSRTRLISLQSVRHLFDHRF